MREVLAITKALADPNRVRVLMFLRPGELCLCQIIELLHLAPSTVSKHMSVLHAAGLVQTRKSGRWMYYRLPPRKNSRCVRRALEWLRASLANDPLVRKDVKRLKNVLRMSLQTLCAHYRN